MVMDIRRIGAAFVARLTGARLTGVQLTKHVRKSNRASTVDVDRYREAAGLGQDWARTAYGDYYATSVSVHVAIKLRGDALARPSLAVVRPPQGRSSLVRGERGPGSHVRVLSDVGKADNTGWVLVEDSHPAQRLLDRPNPWYSRGDLWRATETYLSLWGSAFWALERDEQGRPELWPLRPDRVRVLPDQRKYVRGYVYFGMMGTVAYTPEEMVWMRYFNPLEEYAGLSPIAPVRLSVDMGQDALKFNRNFFRNSAQPDVIFTTEDTMSDDEVEDFYQRWERRYKGPGNAHRPAIASFIKDIKTLGISHREMEFIKGLRWSLEDVSRVYGVPLPLLSDIERATFENINTAERLFWRNAMIPEMVFLEEQLNGKLMPPLGYPELRAQFDLSAIEALQKDEDGQVERESKLLDRGVLTINEVRRERNLPDVPWGDAPLQRPEPPGTASPSSRSWAATEPLRAVGGPPKGETAAHNGHRAG